MQFYVYDKGERVFYRNNTVFLRRDNWDDYHYKTMFSMHYIDGSGKDHSIGSVKIGSKDMEEGRIFDQISKQFSILPEDYFSLGQTDEYYENISNLGDAVRKEILTALRDVAYDLDLFTDCERENVMRISLLRDISPFTVRSQYHRMARGGARLTKYKFSYTPTDKASYMSIESPISFLVEPESNPPTNVHVLIGRNGTGKTHMIKDMIRSVQVQAGSFNSILETNNKYGFAEFANILCVAFSPFDDFTELDTYVSDIPYTYIGLNKHSQNLLETIEMQFISAFKGCATNERKRKLWRDSIEILKSDPTFADRNVDLLMDNASMRTDDGVMRINSEMLKTAFSQLSSGHKVVLLIITSCVEKIEEKSLVFMDEPENHLHPPLLSALIRALSNLLIDRNGVAIISTHSPVVLQEVPSSCVWTLSRCGNKVIPERLSIQTFGSSIGQLTNEVFGLEVTESGFHKLLADAVKMCGSYEKIVEDFDDQLGNEAKLHLRTLLAVRNRLEG